MSDITEQAASIIAPHTGLISVMPLTTTTSGLDLSLTTELGSGVDAGKFVTLIADGDAVYFFLNNADSGTVDPTATSGATRAWPLPNGSSISFVLRAGYHFVRARTSSTTGYLRMYLSSKPLAELAG